MTKYQRGELMEGWNDCPLPVTPASNGGPNVSAAQKARKRMSRISILGVPSSSDESIASKIPREQIMPPLPTSTLRPPACRAPKEMVIERRAIEKVDLKESEEKLRKLVKNAQITDKEKEFLSKRLIDAFLSLEETHQAFVTQIINGMDSNKAKSTLKTQILHYMMVNNGVSTWGVPLKKLVESME